jgi:hypothetical protein
MAPEAPKLIVKAPRVKLISPTAARIQIAVTARLQGEPEVAEEYYCLTEVWDWDDETESVYHPDCEPYEKGARLKREFAAVHFYGVGSYTITFRLRSGEKTVIRAATDIQVRRSGSH